MPLISSNPTHPHAEVCWHVLGAVRGWEMSEIEDTQTRLCWGSLCLESQALVIITLLISLLSIVMGSFTSHFSLLYKTPISAL